MTFLKKAGKKKLSKCITKIAQITSFNLAERYIRVIYNIDLYIVKKLRLTNIKKYLKYIS